MRLVLGGVIMVRHADDRLQVAYHVHPSKGSKVFLRTPTSSAKPREARLLEIVDATNKAFAVCIGYENIVPALSFADILRDEATYSEHYVAILGEGFDVQSQHTFESTEWVDVDDMFKIQWPWYRTSFVRQVCTVLKVLQEHYNILKRRTPRDVGLAHAVAAAQRNCLAARQIVIDAGRTDLLYGVTVLGLRGYEAMLNEDERQYDWYEENHAEWITAMNTPKSLAVHRVFDLVVRQDLCHELLSVERIDDPDAWFRSVDMALICYDRAHFELFGAQAHKFLTAMYRAAAGRLACEATTVAALQPPTGKIHEPDEEEDGGVPPVLS